MSDPSIRLYGIRLSHPVLAVRGMLDRKGLPYRYVELLFALRVIADNPTVPAALPARWLPAAP